jgi:hypothetical protein
MLSILTALICTVVLVLAILCLVALFPADRRP